MDSMDGLKRVEALVVLQRCDEACREEFCRHSEDFIFLSSYATSLDCLLLVFSSKFLSLKGGRGCGFGSAAVGSWGRDAMRAASGGIDAEESRSRVLSNTFSFRPSSCSLAKPGAHTFLQ